MGIFENSLPVLNAVPGGKIGLANAVCMLCAIYLRCKNMPYP
ncbi:MAG: Gx transporter family protein [Clostridiales bacterium]|nr:MAG: Gx transporter family protein [Clostridiales bacterium]